MLPCEHQLANSGDRGGDLIIEVAAMGDAGTSGASPKHEADQAIRREDGNQETAAKSGEIAQLQQEGPLPSTDAEGTLPTPQAATDAVSGRDPEKLSERWELVAILLVLAVAGVVGTHIRIELEEGFNYEGLWLMKDWSTNFPDLPANMVGCYFMGIVGVVCKAHIARYSELLSLGLATGLMGSITTYSSWNQDMAALFVAGMWAKAIFGIIVGLELPFVSLIIGMHSGQAILWTCTRLQKRRQSKGLPPLKPTPDNLKRRKAVAWIAGILWLGILLPGNIIVAAFEFGDTGRHIQTIAACVAPLGVWLRWYLSRFNGSVLKGSPWEWVPWGTLAANLLASVLVTVDKVADVQIVDHVTSVWLESLSKGIMACLSTVSTFMVEVLKLSEGPSPWKSYAYIAISLFLSQLFALILYGIPVWTERYPGAFPTDPKDFEAN